MIETQQQLRKFNLMSYSDESVRYSDNGRGGKILTKIDGLWRYEDEFYVAHFIGGLINIRN
mgnify:CR=1 FL=1